MISESRFWKADLRRWADHLEHRTRARRWSDASTARVEKAVMFGFFALRRLMESKGRLSDSTIRTRVHLNGFPSKSRHITLINWLKVDRHFSLTSPRSRRLGVEDLCNQFIHSYVFIVLHSERAALQSFLVASEWGRRKILYEVPIRTIVRLFRRAAADDPNAVNAVYDATIRDYRVSARTVRDREHAA